MTEESKKVTVCLTSCNRFDLLKQTLDSFFNINVYPIEKFIITEDSANIDMQNLIMNNYGNKVELIFNTVNLGPYRSIDNMYNKVNTEYIFHCEDDWVFNKNPFFIKDSMDILEERKDVNQVWIISENVHPHAIEQQLLMTSTNVPYKMVNGNHGGGWCGFSGNPGLRRKSDYLRIFPNGLSEFIVPGKPIVNTEYNCNVNAGKHGYRAAILVNDACHHIGYGHSTHAK
jgi:hypothetical protein